MYIIQTFFIKRMYIIHIKIPNASNLSSSIFVCTELSAVNMFYFLKKKVRIIPNK